MPRNVWHDIVSWQTRRLNNSTSCIDDHHFKEEELNSVGELSKLCSQIVLKCLYLARKLGDLLFYGQGINLHDRSQNGPKPVTNA